METVPLLVAIAMVWSAVALLKLIRAQLWHDVATFLVAVGVGVGVAFLLRASDFAGGVDVGGQPLAGLNDASTIFFGYGLSAAARATYEFKKSFDDNDSAKEPKLFTGPGA